MPNEILNQIERDAEEYANKRPNFFWTANDGFKAGAISQNNKVIEDIIKKRLVDDHFKQYPIIKSIKLLREHYEHEVYWHNGTRKVLKTAMEECEKYRSGVERLENATNCRS